MENKLENEELEIQETSVEVTETEEVPAAVEVAEEDPAEEAVSEDETSAEQPEPVFTSDFTVGDVRKRAKVAQKGHVLKTTPKALLYMICMMIPTMLVYILGSFKMGTATWAGRAIEIIAVLIPVVFGGPLTLGFISGIMHICRGEKFKVKDLFSLFTDARFARTTGVYILMTVISGIIMVVLQIPMALLSNVMTTYPVLLYIYELVSLIITMLLTLRFAMAFPLIADHPDMKIAKAVKLSFKNMKGNSVKLLLVTLSYIGWYALAFVLAVAAIAVVYLIGNSFLAGMTDFLTYYMAMLRFMLIFYISAYLILMIAFATVLVRPTFGFVAFYDTLTCRQWPEKDAAPADPFDWEITEPESTEVPEIETAPETEPEVSDSSADAVETE